MIIRTIKIFCYLMGFQIVRCEEISVSISLPQNASHSAVQVFYITWLSSKGNENHFSPNEKLLMILSTSYFAVCLEFNMLGVKKLT